MDNSEFKIIKTNYSSDDLIKINEYNQTHIDMARELLNYNKEKILNDSNYANLDMFERVKIAQNEEKFKIFCRTYPIVSKYIIAFGLFSTKAFVKFLNWKSTIRPSDSYRSELIQNQRKQELWKNKYVYGVYVKYLYQEKNKHASLNEINQMYQESIRLLNEETNAFFDKYEIELEKIEETKLEYSTERKNKIKDQLKLKLEKNL
jgi:hypothetical protein